MHAYCAWNVHTHLPFFLTVDWLINWFVCLILHHECLIDWLIDWLTDWLIDWLIWLIDWLIAVKFPISLQSIRGRPTDPTQASHSDTSHLIQETDDVAFWDMASHGNFGASTIVLTAGEDEEMKKFHPIGSIPVIIGLVLIIVCLSPSISVQNCFFLHNSWFLQISNVILVFIVPAVCGEACGNGTTALAVIIYLQIAFFAIILTADFLLRRIHGKSRSCGYLEFYRRTRFYRKFPLVATSVGKQINQSSNHQSSHL